MRHSILAAALLFFWLFPARLVAQTATAWPEADHLFHTDPRWLGADAAYSVDLGSNRILWIFEETFLANPGSHSRRNAAFVHNTVAIQHGYNPAHAVIDFHWRTHRGHPTEIFPNEGPVWIWPDAGIRVANSLIVFAERVISDSHSGFKSDGWTAYLIRNPDADPSTWRPKKITTQHDTVLLASAIVPIGDFVYLFGQSEPEHDLYAARVPAQQLAAGHLDTLTWWNGHDWTGTRTTRQLLIHDAGTETSIQPDPITAGFLEINSQGYGASDIVLRRAPALTGPWSVPKIIYRPPESDQPDPFVYAGKSHPELRGADLILTYATNGFTDATTDNLARYFPRFVRVTLSGLARQTEPCPLPTAAPCSSYSSPATSPSHSASD